MTAQGADGSDPSGRGIDGSGIDGSGIDGHGGPGGRYTSILFDLDGTLTNPKVGITRSVAWALRHFGIVIEDTDTLTPYIGPPLRSSFMTMHRLTADDAERAVAYYREYFEETGIYENERYEGIDGLLARLEANDRKLFVATSKPHVYAAKVLRRFGIDRHFIAVEGAELDGTRSAKAEVVATVLERHHLCAASCVMVGDRSHDIEGAHANGLDSIGVGWGFGSREELEGAGATWYVGSVDELAALLGG